MAEALGFLSYTRRDDEFFGGYITAFRKSLEAGVQVVTGERAFRVFQDIEGIVIGEQWEKKLAEVIGSASFFLPMLSPLFLSSPNCRDEVELFLARESELGREDMILPVYLVDSPKLEKAEERDRDPVAREIAKRQRYDWRENAWLPLQEPAARKAVLTLARAIATALERLTTPRPPTRAGPAGGIGLETARDDDDAAAERIAAVGGAAKMERPGERSVLWVDDRPANNVFERAALEAYGIRFTLAQRTSEAEALLAAGRFDAVISDLGRPGERKAGLNLLAHLRGAGSRTPYFLYTSAAAAASLGPVDGTQGVTADPDELVAMVVAAVL
jgi:CheY-like chemotaxis protein